MKLFYTIIYISCIWSLFSKAQSNDPRAISISRERGIDKSKANKPHYLREESVFSIVIYGAHDLKGNYKIQGFNQEFKIEASV